MHVQTSKVQISLCIPHSLCIYSLIMPFKGGSRGREGGPVPTLIFQNMNFCNGKICWNTPGLNVVPSSEKIFWIRACLCGLMPK